MDLEDISSLHINDCNFEQTAFNEVQLVLIVCWQIDSQKLSLRFLRRERSNNLVSGLCSRASSHLIASHRPTVLTSELPRPLGNGVAGAMLEAILCNQATSRFVELS